MVNLIPISLLHTNHKLTTVKHNNRKNSKVHMPCEFAAFSPTSPKDAVTITVLSEVFGDPGSTVTFIGETVGDGMVDFTEVETTSVVVVVVAIVLSKVKIRFL